MFKYVDICVDMKQGRKCKDALINYRNACQQVNVASLEDVIKYLLQVASARAEEASKAAEAKLEGVEDLEAEASPEEMMLSYVSGEKSKDRTDRELVTPWFKFLWESYRCVGAGGWRCCMLRRQGVCGVCEMANCGGCGGRGVCASTRDVTVAWLACVCCRNVLDILRNNSRLEGLYSMATSRAFQVRAVGIAAAAAAAAALPPAPWF